VDNADVEKDLVPDLERAFDAVAVDKVQRWEPVHRRRS